MNTFGAPDRVGAATEFSVTNKFKWSVRFPKKRCRLYQERRHETPHPRERPRRNKTTPVKSGDLEMHTLEPNRSETKQCRKKQMSARWPSPGKPSQPTPRFLICNHRKDCSQSPSLEVSRRPWFLLTSLNAICFISPRTAAPRKKENLFFIN